jgi:hypothetical protein
MHIIGKSSRAGRPANTTLTDTAAIQATPAGLEQFDSRAWKKLDRRRGRPQGCGSVRRRDARLALLYQEQKSNGEDSTFSKLVRRDQPSLSALCRTWTIDRRAPADR